MYFLQTLYIFVPFPARTWLSSATCLLYIQFFLGVRWFFILLILLGIVDHYYFNFLLINIFVEHVPPTTYVHLFIHTTRTLVELCYVTFYLNCVIIKWRLLCIDGSV